MNYSDSVSVFNRGISLFRKSARMKRNSLASPRTKNRMKTGRGYIFQVIHEFGSMGCKYSFQLINRRAYREFSPANIPYVTFLNQKAIEEQALIKIYTDIQNNEVELTDQFKATYDSLLDA